MLKNETSIHVAAPIPDAKTSPIIDSFDEMAGSDFHERGETQCCFYNGEVYENGQSIVCGGEHMFCQMGVWVKEN